MFKPLSLYIGLRYTRAKRRNHFVSFISLSSMLGIALGVMALITVLSVMNGFQKELRDRILGAVSHATIIGFGGPIKDWHEVTEKVRGEKHVVGAAPYVNAQVMLTSDGQVSGAIIRGILPSEEKQVSDVTEKIDSGSADALKPGSYNIILGSALAATLGVGVGDRVTVITPEARATVAGIVPRVKRFTVAGTFKVGMYEYDRGLALVNLQDASKLMDYHGGITGVRLKFDNMMRAPWLAREVALSLDGPYRVRDWTRDHYNFFRAVNTEKLVMFVILTLIVAVAAFNIVSTLVMVVTDKQSDIAILRTLGASPRQVMGVFIIQGGVIGVIGTLIGTVCGVLLALNVESIVPFIEHLFGVHFLPPDIYYISKMPSDLHWMDVVHIGVVSLVLSLFATIYPAWRASRTQPAEALRYE